MDELKRAKQEAVSELDTIPGGMPEDPGAAAAAEQEAAARAEPDAGASVHRLSRPLQWEGRTYEALTFRWDALTGADHMEIENGLLMRGKTLVVPEYTSDYLCGMAVRACTERDEKGNRALTEMALKVLPLGDFLDICGEARSFLFRARQRGKPSDSGSGSNA